MDGSTILSCLLPGEYAVIDKVDCEQLMERRLADIGFAKGSEIRCLFRSAGGDPAAYRICGTVVALRREDAEKIVVRYMNKADDRNA